MFQMYKVFYVSYMCFTSIMFHKHSFFQIFLYIAERTLVQFLMIIENIKSMVIKNLSFVKTSRDTLESNIIHKKHFIC